MAITKQEVDAFNFHVRTLPVEVSYVRFGQKELEVENNIITSIGQTYVWFGQLGVKYATRERAIVRIKHDGVSFYENPAAWSYVTKSEPVDSLSADAVASRGDLLLEKLLR